MDSKYTFRWTDESIRNLEGILGDIKMKWTEKEVNHFKQKLIQQLQIIERFPTIFPVSGLNPRLRKAVMSKQTSLFYELQDEIIYIVHIFDTRQNPRKLE